MRVRPLRGEPVALDLVNTVWREHGEPVDQLDDLEAVRAWLAEHGLPGDDDLEGVRDRLRQARDALRAALEEGDFRRLNVVLGRGATRPMMRGAEPYDVVVVEDPAWHAAWAATAAFARLIGERPDRVRKCAHPDCVLWFLDASKNGTRRWCSMEGCGNRAKVGRFNRRQKPAG